MRKVFRRTMLAAVALPVLALAGVAQSQQEADPSQREAGQAGQREAPQDREAARQRDPAKQLGQARTQPGGKHGQLDQKMAAWLSIKNQGEIQLAQVASQQSQNDEVKQFSQMMIEDHGQFLQKLRQTASIPAGPAGAVRPGGGLGQEPIQRRGEGQIEPDRPESADKEAGAAQEEAIEGGVQRPGAASRLPARGQEVDLADLQQQVAQQCVQSFQQFLQEKEGAEFDQAYMGQQLLAHMEMVDTLKVFQQHASPQLAQVLAQGTQTAEQHLEKAKQILEGLGDGTPGTARRPGARQEQRKQ